MNHPYQDFETDPRWKVIQKGINELEENQDISVTTAPYYVVGYLMRKIIESEQAGIDDQSKSKTNEG